MTATDPRPFLALTVLLDGGARPAAITRSHGDSLERAMRAAAGNDIAGVDLVELPIATPAFKALRQHLAIDPEVVGLYDLFPLPSQLDPQLRKVAGQFLAAEALWTLEEQGALGAVPLRIKLELPKDWSSDPKEVHAKLVGAGALELTAEAISTFKMIKARWDQVGAAAQTAS